MPAYILFVLALLADGTVEPAAVPFKDLASCEAMAKQIPEKVAQVNTKSEVKIVGYVYACRKPIDAPKGTSI